MHWLTQSQPSSISRLLDGLDDSINLSTTGFDINLTNEFTVSLWVKPRSLNPNDITFSNGNGGFMNWQQVTTSNSFQTHIFQTKYIDDIQIISITSVTGFKAFVRAHRGRQTDSSATTAMAFTSFPITGMIILAFQLIV